MLHELLDWSETMVGEFVCDSMDSGPYRLSNCEFSMIVLRVDAY